MTQERFRKLCVGAGTGVQIRLLPFAIGCSRRTKGGTQRETAGTLSLIYTDDTDQRGKPKARTYRRFARMLARALIRTKFLSCKVQPKKSLGPAAYSCYIRVEMISLHPAFGPGVRVFGLRPISRWQMGRGRAERKAKPLTTKDTKARKGKR